MTTVVPEALDRASRLPLLLLRAKRQELTLPELFQSAEEFNAAGLTREAADLYRAWIAFNPDHALRHLALFNLGVTLRQIPDLPGAITCFQDALRVDALFGPAHINLGRAFEDCGLLPQAVQQWRACADALREASPERIAHKLMALQHIGRTLENSERLAEAEVSLKAAMELRPDKPEAAQHLIALRQRQCEWPVLTPSEHVSKRQILAAISPLALAAYSDDPMFQLARACHYNRTAIGRPESRAAERRQVRRRIGTGEKLRIGYLSSDLREHAVGFALSEVLETHDKRQLEIYAYYCGEMRPADPVQQRIRAAVDVWRDVAMLSDLDAALAIAADEIDILVDVNGYTKNARTRVVAHRPAPVIVNWCGYPGSMGSPYHQYLIADDEIIPPENEIYYTEQVLRIPCNQPIDRKRPIDPHRPTRAEAGLPENGFVFACFNGMQKITANGFRRWMEILLAVPDSVLWLLSGSDEANERLRGAAARDGVDPARLIFAPKASNPKHLARIAVADLFLDTLPYGAHSTAADALTMGLPILTLRGRGFAARFCASVVSAAGIPDLICDTAEDYVARAISFGRDPDTLAPVRARLSGEARESSTLRDIPGLVRQLERLFWKMQADAERGQLPVPDLTNLEVYFDIGAELDLENIERLDDAQYRRLYREKLAHWNDFWPLPADSRFWPGPDASLRDFAPAALERARA